MLNDDRSATFLKAPKHLGRQEKKLYETIIKSFRFDDTASLELLTQACEARQRARMAREQVEQDGLVCRDDRGNLKPHPLLRVERSAQQSFLAAMRLLRLDTEGIEGKR